MAEHFANWLVYYGGGGYVYKFANRKIDKEFSWLLAQCHGVSWFSRAKEIFSSEPCNNFHKTWEPETFQDDSKNVPVILKIL